MNEIVEKIRFIREQREQLDKQETELMATMNGRMITPEVVYLEFLKLKDTETLNCNQKKMFVFVCSSICFPTFIIGERLKSGYRQKLSTLTGIKGSQITYIIKNVTFLHRQYKDFKTEADYLYSSIKDSLKSGEKISISGEAGNTK